MNATLRSLNPFIHQYDETVRTKEWFQEAVAKHQYTPDLNRLLHKESWWVFVYDECQEGLYNHKLIEDDSHTYGEAMTNDKFTLWKRPLGQLTFPIALDFNEKIEEVKLAYLKGKLVNISTRKLIELDSYKENTVQFNRRRVNLNFFYREQYADDHEAGLPLIMHKIDTDVKYVKDNVKFVEESLPREGVSVYSAPKLQTVRAWMYVGVPDFWLNLARAGRQKITNGWDTERSLTHLRYADGSLIKPATRYIPNNLNNTNEYYYFNATDCTG